MENRILYALLTQIPETDIETLEVQDKKALNEAASNLAKQIAIKIEGDINEYNAEYCTVSRCIMIDFKGDHQNNVYLNITNSGIVLGLNQEISGNAYNKSLDQSFLPVVKRYFTDFKETKLSSGALEINAEFQLKFKALNWRDFIEYAAFVLSKGLALTNEIVKVNAIKLPSAIS